jgi:hypothetical protein
MGILINDEITCIRLVQDGAIVYINKNHIKKVEALSARTVLVDIGKSGQDNIFIHVPDVINPGAASSLELAEIISRMLPQPGNGGGGSGMTDLRLVEIFKELNRLREVTIRLLNVVTVGGDMNSKEAVRIDDTQPGYIYKGYCDGAKLETADNVWVIQRIKNDNGIITNEWPDGSKASTHRWNDRYGLNYKPLN